MARSGGEDCCYRGEYGELFTSRGAERDARAYRSKGLPGSATSLVDGVTALGIAGASILEVGGGAGAIQLELLRAGAGGAVNVDLSPAWEETAGNLFAEHGVADQVERVVGDFVTVAGELDDADVVVLHRVVCCYPHWQLLLRTAADKARHVLALTFPRDTWATTAAIGLENFWRRLRGHEFRAFVHPPGEMLQLLADAGLRISSDTSTLTWRTVVLQRAGA